MPLFNKDQLKELIFRYPNTGLREPMYPDERDFRIGDYVEVPDLELPKFVDLYNSMGGYDQGMTNHCTSYATAMLVQTTSIKETQNQSIEYDPEVQWTNQLMNPGTADEKLGDYLQSAIKSLQFFGLIGRGAKVVVDKYYYVQKQDWKKYLAAGYPLITGSLVGRPMIDKHYNWKPVRKGGGHAYLVVGYDDEKQRYICQNSWGSNWGDKRQGRFYVKYSDAPLLFRAWAIDLIVS